MRLAKSRLTLVMAVLLAVLLVAAAMAGAAPAKKAPDNMVQITKDNLTPQEVKDDKGSVAQSGKISEKEAQDTANDITGPTIVMGKIKPDGSKEVVKVFQGKPVLRVEAIFNEKTKEMEFITPELNLSNENENASEGKAVFYGPKGEKEVIKDKGPVMVRYYRDEAGNIKSEKKVFNNKEELARQLADLKEKGAQSLTITPDTKLPVNIKTNQGELKGDKLVR